jgi:hypothetical protein
MARSYRQGFRRRRRADQAGLCSRTSPTVAPPLAPRPMQVFRSHAVHTNPGSGCSMPQ